MNFAGFIKVVDTLGCAYVNVDHRYFNENVGTPETDYTSINLQPGYQKLCYENALDYVRYRHTDDDFVRVARQQDFLRDLREQIDPSDELGQIDNVARAVGHAITSTFPASASELILLTKLIVFSQAKPLRQVKFLTTSIEAQYNHGDYVTSTPELESQTLNTFLNGREQLQLPAAPPPAGHSSQPQPPQPKQTRRLLAGGPGSVREPVGRRERSGEGGRLRPIPRHLPDAADRTGRTAAGARLRAQEPAGTSSITPTSWSGSRTRSAATTTSRAPTG